LHLGLFEQPAQERFFSILPEIGAAELEI